MSYTNLKVPFNSLLDHRGNYHVMRFILFFFFQSCCAFVEPKVLPELSEIDWGSQLFMCSQNHQMFIFVMRTKFKKFFFSIYFPTLLSDFVYLFYVNTPILKSFNCPVFPLSLPWHIFKFWISSSSYSCQQYMLSYGYDCTLFTLITWVRTVLRLLLL